MVSQGDEKLMMQRRMIHTTAQKEIMLWDITLGGMMKESAEFMGGHEMIKYTDRDYTRSYAEFDRETDLIARAFMALGIEKGDHIAVWATNIPEWIISLYAAAKAGAVLVTVNTSYKIFEMEYLLRQSDTKMLIMNKGFKDVDYPAVINELCPSLKTSRIGDFVDPMLPRLELVVLADEIERPGMLSFERLYDIGQSVPQFELEQRMASLNADEIVNMQYTSGTTGFPKGVMLTHKNIINNGRFIGDCMKFTQNDRLCIQVPFFHCFGLVLGMMAAFTHFTSVVPMEAFSPSKTLKALFQEECTAVHGVPTMFIAMLEHEDFAKYKFTKLRTGIMAGSPCPVKVMSQVVEEMGISEITIVFGQTESSPGCTQTTTDDPVQARVSTVGRELPLTECRIVDPETGSEVKDGVSGEFCARGYNIMRGYYNMPEATAQAIDSEGWLHTGDLAVRDENGYYKIVGRIKDMIIRGGENIYPKEIEEFLYTHEAVSDVQVIGIPSRAYGEEVMACVILKPEAQVSEEQLKEYVRENMARHKIPRYIMFMDSFPMTASGKIQKYKMREWAVEQLALQSDANIETA